MQHNPQRGFTIIEMLIVLAVAGTILSLALVAIPVLQRNSRNNQRAQDVQTILASVSRHALNNSGNFERPSAGFKLFYYENSSAKIRFEHRESGEGVTQTPTLETVIVANRQKCSADQLGKSTPAGAGYADVVALYMIEQSGGKISQRCQEM